MSTNPLPLLLGGTEMNEELEYPNVLIVNEQPETPEEIIDEFLNEIIEKKNDHEELQYVLEDMFDRVYSWATKEQIITQVKMGIQQLEDIQAFKNFNYIDEDDD